MYGRTTKERVEKQNRSLIIIVLVIGFLSLLVQLESPRLQAEFTRSVTVVVPVAEPILGEGLAKVQNRRMPASLLGDTHASSHHSKKQ